MEKTQNKVLVTQSLKSGVLAFVLSCAFVLLIALVAKTFNVGGKGLAVANEICKLLSVGIATAVCISDDKLLVKCFLCALIFSVLSLALFSVLGGSVAFVPVAVDFAVALVVAVVVCLVKNKIKG